jgi:predicted enzyme related to lactoylglutathione lyase
MNGGIVAGGVATVWVPLDDMNRAVRFYGETLGLDVKTEGDDCTEFDANGLTIGLNARKGTHKVRGGGAVVDGRLDDPMELLESEGLRFTGDIGGHYRQFPTTVPSR